MKSETRRIVDRILREDVRAREDDNYLILKVIEKLEPKLAVMRFSTAMLEIKSRKISFESITRARRKFFEENPQFNPKNVDRARRKREEEYYLEYSNHISRID